MKEIQFSLKIVIIEHLITLSAFLLIVSPISNIWHVFSYQLTLFVLVDVPRQVDRISM